jgi:hypothetical protein
LQERRDRFGEALGLLQFGDMRAAAHCHAARSRGGPATRQSRACRAPPPGRIAFIVAASPKMPCRRRAAAVHCAQA